ncbi:LAFA_0E14202g1_1 [Lachancea sp. 'fantastica']|nr:LAFA_0E14202g1_1 [Lachancea sp. 'fantastica']
MTYIGSAILVNVQTPDHAFQTDLSVAEGNLSIRVPNKSSVARLLQYTHSVLYQKCGGEIEPVQRFCLKLKGRTLGPEELVRNIDPENSDVLTLRMEHCIQYTGSALNLDYDYTQDFKVTNLKLEVNGLPDGEIFTHLERGVPWTSTLAQIQELTKSILKSHRASISNNIWTDGQVSIQNMIGFEAKEDSSKHTFLAIDNSNCSMELGDLLGVDYAPDTRTSYHFMFQLQQKPGPQDQVAIRFISDAQLTMDSMNINADSTVQDIKDFICLVYGHTLRLTREDVKLIYKGHLLSDDTSSGHPTKALDYIHEREDVKIHVEINQEYTEPGPGFWNELLSSRDRFSFMPRTARNERVVPSVTAPQERSEPRPVHEVSSFSSLPQEFFTETGAEIKRTGQYFEKVLVSGQESFVQSGFFEPTQTFIELEGQKLQLLPEDFVELRGAILLSHNALSKISSKFGIEVQYSAAEELFTNSFDTHTSHIEQATEQINQTGIAEVEEVGRVARLRQWIQTIMRTIYLILRNSVFFFVILFQFISVLKKRHLILSMALIVGKAIWSTPEIGEMWRELLSGAEEGAVSEEELKLVTDAYRDRQLTRAFYHRFASTGPVVGVLIRQLSANNQLKLDLANDFKLDHTDASILFLARLLEECTSTQHDEVDLSSLHELFEPLVKDAVEHARNPTELDAASKQVLKELRKFAYQKSSLPWHKSLFRLLSRMMDYIYNGGLIRRLVPMAGRPVRGWQLVGRAIGDVLKLTVLSVLVLVPRFQRQAIPEASTISTARDHQD